MERKKIWKSVWAHQWFNYPYSSKYLLCSAAEETGLLEQLEGE